MNKSSPDRIRELFKKYPRQYDLAERIEYLENLLVEIDMNLFLSESPFYKVTKAVKDELEKIRGR